MMRHLMGFPMCTCTPPPSYIVALTKQNSILIGSDSICLCVVVGWGCYGNFHPQNFLPHLLSPPPPLISFYINRSPRFHFTIISLSIYLSE